MNPFILFEMDLHSLFQKYHGKRGRLDIKSPGIYAIPEDGLNPGEDDFDFPDDIPSDSLDDLGQTALNQKDDNQDNIKDQLSDLPRTQDKPLTQEEIQRYEKEVEPLKKLFLLQKLYSLAFVLKNNFLMDSDLELVIKYGTNFSYKTLYTLTLNILNQLKNNAQAQEIIMRNQQEKAAQQQQEVNQDEK